MKKYNIGLSSIDFNKSEVLPMRLLPTKTGNINGYFFQLFALFFIA